MIKFIKDNKIFLIAAAVVALIFIALNILFPYSGDDWYWATRDFSIAALTEYNGRYLGSALSMIITRFKWLRVIICTAVTLAVLYLVSLNGSGRPAFFFSVAAALFVAMPVSMLNEVLTWASGFANYMTSALVVIAYVALVRGEFADEAPVYKKAMPYLAAALGVFGALFLETVTIGNVIVGAAVLIYHFIRFKKPSATLIAFLAGAIVGAALMFSDRMYFEIFFGDGSVDTGNDRDLLSLSGIWNSYIQQFYSSFAFDNVWLDLVLTGSLVWLFIKRFPALKRGKIAAVIVCFVLQAAFLLESVTVFFGHGIIPGTPYFAYEGALKGILTFLYFVSVAATTALLLNDVNVRLKGIFLIGAILAYSLPLLFVTPVGPRNFISVYVLFVALTITILNEDIKEYSEGKLQYSIMCVAMAAALAVGIFYIVRYSVIYSAYQAREEAVYAVTEDDEELVLEHMSVSDFMGWRELKYVHNADPDNDYFWSAFKLYYGLPEELTVSFR